MSHVFEIAPTARSKCRGCGLAIVRGDLRFGEFTPNQFAEGETTLWFHPLCAAFKRPEPLLEALPAPQCRKGAHKSEVAPVGMRTIVSIDIVGLPVNAAGALPLRSPP